MECYVKKLREDAVIPHKAHATDTGYDLWILDKHKELDNGVVMYSTGLQIQPPWGLYFEIVPRSSIIKSGYIQANSIGVVDSGYRGEIKVCLYNGNDRPYLVNSGDRIAQILIQKVDDFYLWEVESLNETDRGDGGFGSSGK